MDKLTECSAKDITRIEGSDLVTVQEEFRIGERCSVS